MATREDNIKKINAQLEQLTDEELEEIAGGLNDFDRPIVDFYHKQNPPQPPQIKDIRFYTRNENPKY